ncbi:phosphopentomutase [Tindallia magadiensis]|uniref:Phosphopentomutase n=1 Tax=Tindallia magadiensis TaxID=69895 RepID=A0A1I3AF47_9FIRM|nr:phosphopentomutase [Tindallia magadiensis]SFH48615.1 phosphopentomutase [Tindallia magadiensis]
MIDRVILLVLDSVGIGALPDAKKYGDMGADTLGNIAKETGSIHLPNLQQLGLGNIESVNAVDAITSPSGAFGRAAELSVGKDTTTGHWEIAGLITKEPFRTFPNGFPAEIMESFEKKIGKKTLGNYAASGTVIIEELGEKHIQTGYPIIYTSADSVFQIAAHEEIIPINELYHMCEVAREMMQGDYALARIIARPFEGKPGAFSRTHRRKDYSLSPPHPTILNHCEKAGYPVIGIGKIDDIFNSQGVTHSIHTENNMDGINQTLKAMDNYPNGLIFTNLVDFDMKYGHRRDALGYRLALEEADTRIPEILSKMKTNDVLLITADHGNDPTHPGTDHTREYVPIIIAGDHISAGLNLGTRCSFADIASTISELLNTRDTGNGIGFSKLILKS